ncbi:protein phosphatase [Amycolatopsis arida]|uniref:Protein phosphatase n=1 Tax=Amycolatopsis arida TaxID=587909 RepID=A0A1I5LH02_9PSEU|nr:protein phosphatase 2C domain-containing protein [Amycolatopsis arida]TDX93703.1 protein phosphatase [Amycolatopsis arida]SFO95991.1 protein phosphatase [Amycolatopsis arida]
MQTTPHLNTPRFTRSDAASSRGPREINADAVATATDPATGRAAFVVADGIGDHLLAARAARLAAHTAATAAVQHGPAGGLLDAQRALRAEFDQKQADCVLVVAVLPPAGGQEETIDIAWVGDCRAYRWNGSVLHQITVDHSLAEFWRARGVPTAPRAEHVVIDSVRTASPLDLGHARIGAGPGRLLLCTDGVHKPLDLLHLRALLTGDRSTRDTAAAVVGTAHELGGTDNATAVVIDRLWP